MPCFSREKAAMRGFIHWNQGLAVPGVREVQNFQSALATSVSRPFGDRQSAPSTVLESATDVLSAVPSTSETGFAMPGISAAVIEPS
jgi:hypothetical protein